MTAFRNSSLPKGSFLAARLVLEPSDPAEVLEVLLSAAGISLQVDDFPAA